MEIFVKVLILEKQITRVSNNSSKISSNANTNFLAGGKTIYPRRRLASKSDQKYSKILKQAKKQFPIQSLDIKLPKPSKIITESSENLELNEMSPSNNSIGQDVSISNIGFPELCNQFITHNSATSESILQDVSVDSRDASQKENRVELEPYKIAIKRHINSYIKSKNQLRSEYLHSKQYPNKKLVFAKLERMRLLSESELRKILFKEIEENKRYLEHLNNSTNNKRLFKNESLSNSRLNEDYSIPKFKDQCTDVPNFTLENFNKSSVRIRNLNQNSIKISPKLSVSANQGIDSAFSSLKHTPQKIGKFYKMKNLSYF